MPLLLGHSPLLTLTEEVAIHGEVHVARKELRAASGRQHKIETLSPRRCKELNSANNSVSFEEDPSSAKAILNSRPS